MRISLPAFIFVIAVVPASAFATPIGYRGQIQASATAGFPNASETHVYSTPVSSLSDLVVLNDSAIGSSTPFDGSAHVTAQVEASGGSTGIYILLLANEDLNAPDGFQRSTNASALVQVFYHDHVTVFSPTLAPGTLVPFVGQFHTTRTVTGTEDLADCGTANYGSDGSFIQCIETQSLQIGTQTIFGAGAETNFQIFLPIAQTLSMSTNFSVFAQVASWNPSGPGNGEFSGLGFEYNGLNTFDVFLAPAGPGYNLMTESGISLAFPTTDAAPVPEPATLLLLGTGLAAAGVRRYRHRQQ